jgi:PRTRC genetic system ThiF family protein
MTIEKTGIFSQSVAELFEPAYPIGVCSLGNWNSTSGIQIAIIGLGGGGSQLMPLLTRAMANFRNLNIKLILADPDTVEENNLGRQNFIPADLGKYKVEVLGKRYSRSYGLEIKYKPDLINDELDVITLCDDKQNMYTPLLIITAVDNLPSRKLIHNYWKEIYNRYAPGYWIDLGGEEYHGQVAIGTIVNQNATYYAYQQNGVTTPWITEIYPQILEDAGDIKPNELPCGISSPQSPNRNVSGAVLAMNPILALIETYDKGMNCMPDYHLIEYGIKPPVVRVRRNTVSELTKPRWAGRHVIIPRTGREGEYDIKIIRGVQDSPERLAA